MSFKDINMHHSCSMRKNVTRNIGLAGIDGRNIYNISKNYTIEATFLPKKYNRDYLIHISNIYMYKN